MRRLAAAALLAIGSATASAAPDDPQASPEPASGRASFVVYVKGARVGQAESSLERTADGWRIRGTSRLGAPLNLTVRRLDIGYDLSWKPRYITMELVAPARTAVISSAFQHGVAFTDIVSKGEATSEKANVAEDTIVLPNLVFSAYEALAARLTDAAPGTVFRRYIMPQGEIAVRVDESEVEDGPSGGASTHWKLTFLNPTGAYPVEVWTANGRMVRLEWPAQGIAVVRADRGPRPRR
jgi:hypothetical protein